MSDNEDAVEILHTMCAQLNSDRNLATATSAARRTKRPHKPLSESPDTKPSAQKKSHAFLKASIRSSNPKQVSLRPSWRVKSLGRYLKSISTAATAESIL